MLGSYKIRNKKFYNIEFEERVLSVRRVVKVVKGGRIFSFSVLVVIGSKNGYFGVGLGKALEVTEARKKAINRAKRNLYRVVLTKEGTIPHLVESKYGSTRVVLRPASVGRGIIAGGVMRVIFECIGIRDIVAKCIGSSSPCNLAISTINALLQLKSKKYYKLLGRNDGDVEVLEEDAVAEEVE